MITQIGFIAGEILILLDQLEGPVPIGSIKCKIDAPEDVILMSLGWLIRERYVCAVTRATGIEIRQLRNGTNEGLQERALDVCAVAV